MFPWHFSEVQIILLHFLPKWKGSCVFSQLGLSCRDLPWFCKWAISACSSSGFPWRGLQPKILGQGLQPFLVFLLTILPFNCFEDLLYFKLRVCQGACAHACLCLWSQRLRIPLELKLWAAVRCLMWVLGIDPVFSVEGTNSLTHWPSFYLSSLFWGSGLHSAAQAALELTITLHLSYPPVSASQILSLHVWATRSDLPIFRKVLLGSLRYFVA